MTSGVNEHLESVRGIRAELLQLLDGMDYCLDWKPDPSAWSARQVVYHLLDTPPGGIHVVVWGMVSGDLREFELWADLDNMTPDRLAYDVEQVREDVNEFCREMEVALEAATGEDLDSKSILAHRRTRGIDEVFTLQMVLERYFDRHWRDHLDQIKELRQALGM